jgi:hypothetical protein
MGRDELANRDGSVVLRFVVLTAIYKLSKVRSSLQFGAQLTK